MTCCVRGAISKSPSRISSFAAKISRLNSFARCAALCEALSAFLLLSNALVDNAQKISSIAACNYGARTKPEQQTTVVKSEAVSSTDKPKAAAVNTVHKTNDDYIRSVSVNSVAHCHSVGPLLDDGAPYSGIGEHEFIVL